MFALFQIMWISWPCSRRLRLRAVLVDLLIWVWTGCISKRAGKATSAAVAGQQQLVSHLCGCAASRGEIVFIFWQANPLRVCVYLCAAWAWSVIRRGAGGSCLFPGGQGHSHGVAAGSGVRIWQPVSTVCVHERVRCERAAGTLTFGEEWDALVCERLHHLNSFLATLAAVGWSADWNISTTIKWMNMSLSCTLCSLVSKC